MFRRNASEFAILLVLAAITISCGCEPATESPAIAENEALREGVFIHLTHGVDDPHRVLMALRMAELMAADRDVLMYFDIKGIEAVLAESPDLEMSPFPSSKTQLSVLLDLGVPLYACPGCLEAAGRIPTDLFPGVQVAEKDAFFEFTEGRILTLDY